MTNNPIMETYEMIKQKILSGEYYPSQRLVETKLAKDLSSSRHHIRIAFERLNSDGLVHLEPHQGATVTTIMLEDVVDIFIAREALEVEVFRLAFDRLSSSTLQQLESFLRTMEESVEQGDYEQYTAATTAFRQIIYDLSQNKTIPELIHALLIRIERLRLRLMIIPLRGSESLEEHYAILQALQSHDLEAVEKAVRCHMRSVRTDIQKYWDVIRP